jgi:hypothetical protein
VNPQAVKRQHRTFQGDVLIPENAAQERRLQRAAKARLITRIAKGLYVNAVDAENPSTDTLSPVALMVRRNWQQIAGHMFPNSTVSHRSALVGGITPDNELILSSPTRFNRTHALPGLSIVLLKGPERLSGDMTIGASGLNWSSRPRMLLENLGKSRGGKRTVGKAGVEEKLVEILNASGEDALNQIRDDARGIAPMLEADPETLHQLIGPLLGTYAKGTLTTRSGKLMARGTPADTERLNQFRILADALRTSAVPAYKDQAIKEPARTHAAFLESYFSNYVEGTRFSIEEAQGIALHNTIVPNRSKDSHDILGVFTLILHPHFRSSLPAPVDILEGIKERHRIMLERRPEAIPGEFKEDANFAGQTKFVEPACVRGTLLEAAGMAQSVPEGLARAIFYAFLVSEIHPFNDGNGRLSRLLMNAEMSRLGQARVIIPTLYHEQYVDAQRALSRRNDPEPLIRAVSRIAEWSTLFDYANVHSAINEMKQANAFEEDLSEFRLLRPDGSTFA